MIAGLLLRIWRETRLQIVLIALGLLIVERLLMFVLPQVQEQMSGLIGSLPFARSMLSALLGIEIGGELTAQMLQSIVWVHPVVLTLVWGHEIVLCTRFPAGEIDRGTIDVLLGLPASRRIVYLAESIVGIASGALIIACGGIGYFWGASALDPSQRPAVDSVLLVMANLFCVYLSVGATTLLISAMSDRRARAIAVVLALLLASFLLNFLAQFWPPAQRLAFLGVLNYYEPAQIISSGEVPLRHVIVLLSVAAAAWLAGLEIVARRSITTV